MHKELGWDRASTTDSNWSKGCPTPCSIMLNNKYRLSWLGGLWGRLLLLLLWVWLGISWQVVSTCIVHRFLCMFLYNYHHYFPFLFFPIKLSLPQPTSFTFFFSLSLILLRGQWANGWVVLSYLVGLNHSTFHSQEGLSALKALFWERGKNILWCFLLHYF